MLRNLIKNAIAQTGIYYCKRQYLPMGIDWHQDIKRSLERAGEPRSIQNILDVGANVGQTTIELRKAFPCGTIHAFEPVGSTFRELLQNVGRMPKVHCHQLALCDQRGTALWLWVTIPFWGTYLWTPRMKSWRVKTLSP